MEEPKLTGMLVTDLKKEIVEQYKEIEGLKKQIEELKIKNNELSGMLGIARDLLDDKTKKAEGNEGGE